MDEKEVVKPLVHAFTSRGRASLTDALRYQSERGGEEAAERFYNQLFADLDRLCQSVTEEIEQGGRPAALPDPEASAYLSRPAYRHRMETAKKRARRSSSGLWYVFYVLTDETGQGKSDTLTVYLIHHSAASFSVESNDSEDDSAE